jgi:hypothetical protein
MPQDDPVLALWLTALAPVVAGLPMTAQAAEPATVTLTCRGTTTEITQTNAKPEPISMDITIDFAARAVEAFGSDVIFRIAITDVTDTTITFGASDAGEHATFPYGMHGTIDRVTGAVEATFLGSIKDGPKWITGYSLQCRPARTN